MLRSTPAKVYLVERQSLLPWTAMLFPLGDCYKALGCLVKTCEQYFRYRSCKALRPVLLEKYIKTFRYLGILANTSSTTTTRPPLPATSLHASLASSTPLHLTCIQLFPTLAVTEPHPSPQSLSGGKSHATPVCRHCMSPVFADNLTSHDTAVLY